LHPTGFPTQTSGAEGELPRSGKRGPSGGFAVGKRGITERYELSAKPEASEAKFMTSRLPGRDSHEFCPFAAPLWCACFVCHWHGTVSLWERSLAQRPLPCPPETWGRFGFFAHRRGRTIPGRFASANRAASAHRWAIPVPRRFASANRGPASNPTRLFCRWQRFAGFLETGSLHPPPAAHCLFPHTP